MSDGKNETTAIDAALAWCNGDHFKKNGVEGCRAYAADALTILAGEVVRLREALRICGVQYDELWAGRRCDIEERDAYKASSDIRGENLKRLRAALESIRDYGWPACPFPTEAQAERKEIYDIVVAAIGPWVAGNASKEGAAS